MIVMTRSRRLPVSAQSAGQRPAPPAALAALVASAGLLQVAPRAWPLWALALVALLPWLPLVGLGAAWARGRHPWLAVFYLLVVAQGGHVLEHAAQMVQLHLLGLSGPAARGVFGALDLEWVHFAWNTWVLLAVLLLLRPFPANGWLRLAALLAGWHELEHGYILAVYLATGAVGTPGVLGQGGVVAGGLPLARPDLHFLYNLVETAPLALAFLHQARLPRLRVGERAVGHAAATG
jgi:hypothetical protein